MSGAKRVLKKFPPIRPTKAWAMVDPETGYICPGRIYENKARNGGRGSITEGWKTIRVEIIPVIQKRR